MRAMSASVKVREPNGDGGGAPSLGGIPVDYNTLVRQEEPV